MAQNEGIPQMSGDVCGNCGNFKPKPGEKFYNCTKAEYAGVKYGMQVRADTRSCGAFMPAQASPEPASTPSGERAQPVWFRRRPRRRRPRGTLLIACLIADALASWAVYLFAAEPTGTTEPVTTPPSGDTATPQPGTIYIDVGEDQWAVSSDRRVMVSSPSRKSSYPLFTGRIEKAPPGTVFVIIDVTTVNRGEDELSTEAGDFSLTDSEGDRAEPQPYKYHHVGKPYPDVDLSPGEVASGRVFWIVPNTASGLEVSYLLDPDSDPPLRAVWKLPW